MMKVSVACVQVRKGIRDMRTRFLSPVVQAAIKSVWTWSEGVWTKDGFIRGTADYYLAGETF